MQVPEILSLGAGIAMLVASAALLLLVVQVERLAEGSAMAESVGYVVAASLSLAVSVLLSWVGRFMEEVEVVELASDLLVALAVVLFVIYFVRVRNSLRKYLADASDILAKMHAAEQDEDD